ncbi:hypothetical protein RI129_009317 [Pyrocoelia pectoralis]|uniref:C2H2-type domain-containing protein n=1 Tax=Pyrocoelia pectoralis TaxID=417401 RepID=A0AAN7V1K7_9COLE
MEVLMKSIAQSHVQDRRIEQVKWNQLLEPGAIMSPDCFGYLMRMGQKSSNRRYCILKDGCLYFYYDTHSQNAFGVACLYGYTVHESPDKSIKFAFEVMPGDLSQKPFYFYTETEQDQKRLKMFPFSTVFNHAHLHLYANPPLSTNEPFSEDNSVNITSNRTETIPGKSQSCNICGRVLSSASSYYVHMKVHSNSKPFQCTSCEAAFCRKPYLEAHLRTHTGERPFKCNYCDKRFTQKSSLNTHKRMHTGERPYSCDICEKKFAVKSYVTAHRWTHLSEKPLSCSYCSLHFTSKHQFLIHSKTHTTRQMFNCTICGRSFAKDSYLIRHQNRVHRYVEVKSEPANNWG